MMREIHGIADATKVSGLSADNESVKIVDGRQFVSLQGSQMINSIGLTPDRARYIAKLLIASAKRVEQNMKDIGLAAELKEK